MHATLAPSTTQPPMCTARPHAPLVFPARHKLGCHRFAVAEAGAALSALAALCSRAAASARGCLWRWHEEWGSMNLRMFESKGAKGVLYGTGPVGAGAGVLWSVRCAVFTGSL